MSRALRPTAAGAATREEALRESGAKFDAFRLSTDLRSIAAAVVTAAIARSLGHRAGHASGRSFLGEAGAATGGARRSAGWSSEAAAARGGTARPLLRLCQEPLRVCERQEESEVGEEDEEEPEAEGSLDQIAAACSARVTQTDIAAADAWQDLGRRFFSAIKGFCDEEEEQEDSWLRCCACGRRQKEAADWDADTESTTGSWQEDAEEDAQRVGEPTREPVDLAAWGGVSRSFARALAACDSEDE